MSTDNTIQQGLPSATTPGRHITAAGHLTGAKPAGKIMECDRDSEAFCLDCGNRVTVGRKDGVQTEFGHDPACPHRPAGVDVSAGGDSA